MKLSIITVNYNNLAGLKRTFENIVSQSFHDYEWIVIDGGSSDGSVDFINERKNYFSFSCSEHDCGPYDAMNKGIVHAKGEYVNFMNSGDMFADEDVLLRTFANPLDADVLYGDYYVIKDDIKELRTKADVLDLRHVCMFSINHQASFIKRALFADNLYDLSYKIIADRVWFVEHLLHGSTFVHLPFPVSCFEFGGLSSNEDMIQKEITRMYHERIPQSVYRMIDSLNVVERKFAYNPELDSIYELLNERRLYKRIIHIALNLCFAIKNILK